MRSDHSWSLGHISGPKPSSRPIIWAGSGAANSLMASTRQVPSAVGSARAPSISAVTVSRTWSSQRLTARGVKRRDTTFRRSMWWGSSRPMIDRSAGMLGR